MKVGDDLHRGEGSKDGDDEKEEKHKTTSSAAAASRPSVSRCVSAASPPDAAI